MSTLMRWNPIRETMSLLNEFDRMFENTWETPLQRWQGSSSWGLALDVAENDNTFIVKASVPGMKPEDIDITLTDNVLTIKGEMQEDETKEEGQYHLRERRFGRFSRTITLPTRVASEGIEADYENGVLTVSIPKAEETRPKRISVNANGEHRKLLNE